MWIFFFSSKYYSTYYTIHGWLNPQMWNLGYGGLTMGLEHDWIWGIGIQSGSWNQSPADNKG